MKRILLSVFSLFIITSIATGSNLNPIWSEIYSGSGDNSDGFNKIIPDGSGNFIAVGYTIRQGNYKDFLTVKLNSSGDTLWWRTKNGNGNGDDVAVAAGVDPSGNVFVTGYSDGGSTNDDILTIMYDANGNLIWDTTWNAPSNLDDAPVALIMDPRYDIIIAGNVEPDVVAGSSDYIVLKYASNGSLLWQQQFSRAGVSNGKDELTGLALSKDVSGDVYVTGRSSNGGDDDYYTIKYGNTTGALAWAQVYNAGVDDRATAIATDNAGNVIVTGRSDNGSNDDFRTIKYNAAGTLQWTRAYNGTANQNDRATAIYVDGSDNVYVAGQSDVDASAVTNYDFAGVKYNSAGTIQWARTSGLSALQADIPLAILVDGSGNTFITGYGDVDGSTTVANDMMTVMINSGGTLAWTRNENGSRNSSDISSSLISDGSGNVIIAGSLNNSTTQADASLVAYSVAGNKLWTKNWNGKGDFSESAKKIIADGASNSYVAGYSFVENHNLDAVILKLSPSGSGICQYSYNGLKSDDDEFETITFDPSGNIIAGGYTKVSGQKSDFLLVKWNPTTCDTVWTRTYDYSFQSDKIVGVVTDASGDVYVTGRSDRDGFDTIDNYDIFTMKYTSAGQLIWASRFNGTGNANDEPVAIQLDPSGNVIVCGTTKGLNDEAIVVMKYNPLGGTYVWSNEFIFDSPTPLDDRALDMTIDNAGNVFISGYTQSISTGSEDALVLSISSSGTLLNSYSYNGTGNGDDRAEAIAYNSNDASLYFVVNSDVDPDTLISNYNILTQRSDINLNLLWSSPAIYDSPVGQDDLASDITCTAGYIVVGGSTESDTLNGQVNKNFLVMHYSNSGTLLWYSDFDGAFHGDDDCNSVFSNGSIVWGAGFSTGSGNAGKDMLINTYDLTNSIADLNKIQNSIVYPNPVNNISSLKWSGSASPNTEVYFTDATGRKLFSAGLLNGMYTIDASAFPNGMIFYHLVENGIVSGSGKFVVNK